MPQVDFTPTKDTYISSLGEDRELNAGGKSFFKLYRSPNFLPIFSTRILLQFDISEIAPGSTINIATLKLEWISTDQASVLQAEVYKMSYDDWLESCNYYTTDGQTLGESNGWPGTFPDPDTPRNFASNDFDPGSVVLVRDGLTLRFSIRNYIPDALSIKAGILSVLVRVPPGNKSFRTYASKERVGDSAPNLRIDWTPPSFALTMTEGSNGTCTADPDQPAYQEDDVVTLTVTPDDGFSFDGWSGDDAGDVSGPVNGKYSITMDADKAIQCDFAADTLKLTLNEGSNGTSALFPTGEEPLHTYDENELFFLLLTPDAGFQVDQLTVQSGDAVAALTETGQTGDGYKHVSLAQELTQNTEWTSVFKALHTLTTTIVGGAHGTVANGSAVLTWPQEPKYAFGFIHIVSIKPDVGYQAQVQINAGTIVNVKGTLADDPIFGFEATDWLFTPPDGNATLTVTWILIAAGQSTGGLYRKPFDDDRGRNIL